MVEVKKTAIRKKPKFLRTDWHKKIRLGRGVKKNQKWHGAKGRQNKFRLCRKGRGQRPKVGWGASSDIRDKIAGFESIRVENVADIMKVKAGLGIIIGKVGMKKRKEMIVKANEMKLKVLNRYKLEDKLLKVTGDEPQVIGKVKDKGDKK